MSLELSPEAQARLNDKSWRRAQSKWMLWIYLSISMFGAVGFARLAIKTKDEMLKKYAYFFSGLMFLIFILIGLYEIFVGIDLINEPFLVFAHLEKIIGFLDGLGGNAMVRAFAVHKLPFLVEPFTAKAVKAFIA